MAGSSKSGIRWAKMFRTVQEIRAMKRTVFFMDRGIELRSVNVGVLCGGIGILDLN